MVHEYKLVYFNGRGRAEPTRLIFAYADVHYIDHRFEEGSPEWLAFKPKTPFGKIPILDIDNGKVILAQSKAIARYLGKEFDLIPKDHLQAARGDMLVDGYEDMSKHFDPCLEEQDEHKKKEMWHRVEKEHVVPFLAICEKALKENGTKYFLTNSITWADLFLFDPLHHGRITSPHIYQGLDKLNEFIDTIEKEPKIHAWIEKRPKTDW